MKFITDYKEFEGNINHSLLDHLSPVAIDDKADILRYLKSGIDDGVRCSCIYDYVHNEPTFTSIFLFSDGEFFWDSEEIYHFEKYNMELDSEFLKKVRSYKP